MGLLTCYITTLSQDLGTSKDLKCLEVLIHGKKNIKCLPRDRIVLKCCLPASINMIEDKMHKITLTPNIFQQWLGERMKLIVIFMSLKVV